ncbi:MAG: hypothetical protein ACRCTD_13925 [Beijerinckiaceae bacterium]
MLRLAIFSVAGLAFLIAATLLPDARRIDRGRTVLRNLLNDQPYPFDDILALQGEFRKSGTPAMCQPDGEAPQVMIAAWLADHSAAQIRPQLLEILQQDAIQYAATAIRCHPLHPLGWLVRARFHMLTHGASDTALSDIRHTYTLAPRETWVMKIRAGILVSLHASLSSTDRGNLISDIVGLVDAGAHQAAIQILRNTERAFQHDIAARIAALPFQTQRYYQSAALQAGVDVSKLSIPRAASDGNR